MAIDFSCEAFYDFNSSYLDFNDSDSSYIFYVFTYEDLFISFLIISIKKLDFYLNKP